MDTHAWEKYCSFLVSLMKLENIWRLLWKDTTISEAKRIFYLKELTCFTFSVRCTETGNLLTYLLRPGITLSLIKSFHYLIKHCISYFFGFVQSSVSLDGVNLFRSLSTSIWVTMLVVLKAARLKRCPHRDEHNGQLIIIFSLELFH